MKKTFVAVISFAMGIIVASVFITKIMQKIYKKSGSKVDKFKAYYYMLNQWFAAKQRGEDISNYFLEKGYKRIAICGMGEMGQRLIHELRDTDIVVDYGIDKNLSGVCNGLKTVDYDSSLEKVDAIVVTATFDYKEIEKKLSKLVNYPILSLEDIIFEQL